MYYPDNNKSIVAVCDSGLKNGIIGIGWIVIDNHHITPKSHYIKSNNIPASSVFEAIGACYTMADIAMQCDSQCSLTLYLDNIGSIHFLKELSNLPTDIQNYGDYSQLLIAKKEIEQCFKSVNYCYLSQQLTTRSRVAHKLCHQLASWNFQDDFYQKVNILQSMKSFLEYLSINFKNHVINYNG